MSTPVRVGHWRMTRGLMLVMLGLWLFVSLAAHIFADALNAVVVRGFPLGYYMAAQGSLVAFVVMLAWFARRQDAIDAAHDVADED